MENKTSASCEQTAYFALLMLILMLIANTNCNANKVYQK